MRISIKLLLSLLSLITVMSCQKPGQASNKSAPIERPESTHAGTIVTESDASGTVHGGGGNSVANPETGGRTLLDLAENIDKVPYDLNVKKLLKLDQPESQGVDPERALIWKKYVSYNTVNDVELMKSLIGNDQELFIWALRTALTTNEELATGFASFDSTYQMHLEAYGLKGDKIVKNVTYAMTDKVLPDFGDTGIIQVSNPESKKQLAVQDQTGFVLIDKNEFEKLDVGSQIALKLHETVLYLMLKFNPALIKSKGTAPIREFVKNLMNYVYFGPIKNTVIVSPEIVKKSYLALGFPKVNADYSLIGKISDAAKSTELNCELKQIILPDGSLSANYAFYKNGVEVSGAYSMESDFFLKIQLHLVKNGICTFKPQPCTIKYINFPWEKIGGYRLFIDKTALPDKSNDFFFVQSELKKKYQTARLCQ